MKRTTFQTKKLGSLLFFCKIDILKVTGLAKCWQLKSLYWLFIVNLINVCLIPLTDCLIPLSNKREGLGYYMFCITRRYIENLHVEFHLYRPSRLARTLVINQPARCEWH